MRKTREALKSGSSENTACVIVHGFIVLGLLFLVVLFGLSERMSKRMPIIGRSGVKLKVGPLLDFAKAALANVKIAAFKILFLFSG